MATFYARYPATIATTALTETVQGPGTAGTPTGGVLTIQGDPAGTPVPISGSISATNPSVSATGGAVPASATYVGMVVAGNLTGLPGTASGLKVDGSAVTQPISAASLPLPTGAATLAKQPALGTAGTASADVITVQGSTSMTPLLVNGSGSTQPISGTVAATQSGTWTVQPGNTANTTAWKVDGSAVTQPVSGTVTANQGGTWNITNVSGTVSLPTGAATLVAQGTGNTSLASIDTKVPALGQAVMASSVPVVIASNQSTVPVSLASVPAVTTSTAVFQAEGAVIWASITNSYVTLFTPSAATKILQMRNNTNAGISVSFDAGSTTNYTLDAGDQVSLDLLANSLVMSTTAIQVKYAVGAPTSGFFRINGAH